MGITRSELAGLVGHINAMRTSIDAIQRRLDESQRLVFQLMQAQGLAEDPTGLTTPEERGT